MRLHLILPFLGYLFRKSFSGVFSINKQYRREMEKNPGLMIFAGTLCGAMFTAVTTLIGALLLHEFYQVKYVFFAAIATAVSYITYTFFSIQFSNFLEERQELFDVIKDDRGFRKPML